MLCFLLCGDDLYGLDGLRFSKLGGVEWGDDAKPDSESDKVGLQVGCNGLNEFPLLPLLTGQGSLKKRSYCTGAEL